MSLSAQDYHRWLTRDDIAELHAECEHGKRELRRRTISGGAIQIVEQCLDCGEPVGSAVKKSLAPPDIKVFDDSLKQRYRERKAADRVERARQRRQEWFSRYSEYLSSDQWRAKRALVMERAEGLCEGCRSSRATEVHHLTYEHVGDEFLFELVAICHQCHERLHADKEAAE